MLRKYFFYFCVMVFGVGLYPLFSAEASREFYVNSEYEPTGNTLEEAVNLTSSTRAQFFVEKDYYDKLSEKDKDIFLTKTAELGVVFDSEIYSQVKSLFGDEWTPGIDNDSRITVYITDMKSEINGYFREIDEYDYFKYPNSNQREMVYINAKYVIRDTASAILAHEFQHLVSFNQKKRLRVLDEEEWLNEAMSEYAITFSGQDKSDYLENAVKNFLAVQNLTRACKKRKFTSFKRETIMCNFSALLSKSLNQNSMTLAPNATKKLSKDNAKNMDQ